jgi:recyclin-1
MVGEIYIVDSPKELGGLVRDVSRYEGTLSADDLYEIGAFASLCIEEARPRY